MALSREETKLAIVHDDVITIVSEFLGKPVEAEDELADLGFDSLDIVEIGMAFEDAFRMESIEVEELDTCETVGDLIDLVEGKIYL